MNPKSTATRTTPPSPSCKTVETLLATTFSVTGKRLPSRSEIQALIYTDRSWITSGRFIPEKLQRTMDLRDRYIKHSHLLLTDEFLRALNRLCKTYHTIAELGAGPGWLSHWLTRYGTRIQATVDDRSWPDVPKEQYLPLVQPMDAVQYVRQNPTTELFILAWPPETGLAAQIWQAMSPGSHLLYIGEEAGGVTADPTFFDLVADHQPTSPAMAEVTQAFLTFDDFHDRPRLFAKE